MLDLNQKKQKTKKHRPSAKQPSKPYYFFRRKQSTLQPQLLFKNSHKPKHHTG